MTARGLYVSPRPIPASGTVRHAVHALLRQLRLTTIFGNPGSTEMPFLRDFPDDFHYVLALQECVALAAADGFARASHGAAFVNLHGAAGLGHAMGALVTAWRNGAPVIVTAGQQARALLPHDPFLFAERATEFPQPYVKWSCEPARAADVPAAIARAYHMAMQYPRGPVFVSIPSDDWDEPAPAVPAVTMGYRTLADPDALATVAALLRAGARTAVIGGTGVADAPARAALDAVATRLDADRWIAPLAARNPWDERHARFSGFLPGSREGIAAALDGIDAVLVVGAPAFTLHVDGAGSPLPAGSALALITADGREAARLPEGIAAIGDVASALRTLLPLLPERRPQTTEARRPAPAPSPDRLTDALVMARLDALRPRGIAVVEEAPSTRGPMHDLLPMHATDEFYSCASGGLGYALPAAIGVALAKRVGPVLCLLGDGSAMYAIQGLWTAAAERVDVRYLVINNGGYAALDHFGKLFGIAPVGTRIDALDIAAIARGQGMPAERVDDPMALDAALGRLFAETGPRLLEVMTEPNT